MPAENSYPGLALSDKEFKFTFQGRFRISDCAFIVDCFVHGKFRGDFGFFGIVTGHKGCVSDLDDSLF